MSSTLLATNYPTTITTTTQRRGHSSPLQTLRLCSNYPLSTDNRLHSRQPPSPNPQHPAPCRSGTSARNSHSRSTRSSCRPPARSRLIRWVLRHGKDEGGESYMAGWSGGHNGGMAGHSVHAQSLWPAFVVVVTRRALLAPQPSYSPLFNLLLLSSCLLPLPPFSLLSSCTARSLRSRAHTSSWNSPD